MVLSSTTADLLSAILCENGSMLVDLLNNGTDLNKADDYGATPLHLAAFTGNENVVNLLIERGARLNAKDKQGLSPLHRAAEKNNTLVADILLKKGCNCWAPCKLFQTPLHTCAIHNSVEVAQLLLRFSAEHINRTDVNGCTALHHAVYYGYLEIVESMLRYGADVNILDKCGRSAVHWMACGGNIEMLSLLQKAGADLSVRDRKGRTILHLAAMSGKSEFLGILLDVISLSIDVQDHSGYTPLHYAVHYGHSQTIRIIVNSGCDLSKQSSNGNTALHIAASHTESAVVIDYLLTKFKNNPSPRNSDGMTPLHLASEWGKVTRVDALLAAGADPFMTSHSRATPLHCAAFSGHQLVVKHLLTSGADPNYQMEGGFTALHLAAHNAFLHITKTLLEMGADVEVRDNCGNTSLMLAAISDAQHGEFTVECLLEFKASVGVANDDGMTALHLAAAKGNGHTVERLLSAGGEADRPDALGRNALHLAVVHPFGSVAVHALCRSNVKCTERRDKKGFYPLHYAALQGNTAFCKYLLDIMECGIEMPSSGNPLHMTPLHLAAMRNQYKVIEEIVAAIKKRIENAEHTYRKTSNVLQPILACSDVKRRIPLHYAMKYGHLESVKVLLSDKGSELYLNWADKDEVTPMHLAAWNCRNSCISWVINQFRDKIGFNRKDSCGRTCGMVNLTGLSIPSPALLNRNFFLHRDNYGRGFLHRSVFSGRKDILKSLLNHCSINSRDSNGVTALHIASALGDRDIVRLLLEGGADRFVTDRRGFTPADWAASRGQLEALEELAPAMPSSSRSSVDSAFGTGDGSNNTSKDSAAIAIQADQSLRSLQSAVGSPGLLLSSFSGHLHCLTYLLELLPRLMSSRDPNGRTALHLAALQGHYECVEYLTENGADLDSTDYKGWTPLMCSVQLPNSVNTLEYLLHKGADVSKIDNDGNTVLHHCCISKNEDAGKVLVEHLSSFDTDRTICNTANNKKQTALHIATSNGLIDFVLMFIPFASNSIWAKDENDRVPLTCPMGDSEVAECMEVLLSFMLDSPAPPLDGSMLSVTDRSSLGPISWKVSTAGEAEFY